MDAIKSVKILGVLYFATTISSLISTISLAIAWQYWTWTLNVCVNVNCGCILYGINTFSTFMGGSVQLCHFGAFGLIPSIFVGLGLTIYHCYRCCLPQSLRKPQASLTSINYQNSNTEDQRPPCKQWMIAVYLVVFVCCLSLAHAVILTDGFYKTCHQYRRNLVRLLGSRGEELQAIHNRLTCSAILDFMDYLQADTNNWRRGDQINTGIALQLAIVMSWVNFFFWILIFFVNSIMAKQSLKNRNGNLYCC